MRFFNKQIKSQQILAKFFRKKITTPNALRSSTQNSQKNFNHFYTNNNYNLTGSYLLPEVLTLNKFDKSTNSYENNTDNNYNENYINNSKGNSNSLFNKKNIIEKDLNKKDFTIEDISKKENSLSTLIPTVNGKNVYESLVEIKKKIQIEKPVLNQEDSNDYQLINIIKKDKQICKSFNSGEEENNKGKGIFEEINLKRNIFVEKEEKNFDLNEVEIETYRSNETNSKEKKINFDKPNFIFPIKNNNNLIVKKNSKLKKSIEVKNRRKSVSLKDYINNKQISTDFEKKINLFKEKLHSSLFNSTNIINNQENSKEKKSENSENNFQTKNFNFPLSKDFDIENIELENFEEKNIKKENNFNTTNFIYKINSNNNLTKVNTNSNQVLITNNFINLYINKTNSPYMDCYTNKEIEFKDNINTSKFTNRDNSSHDITPSFKFTENDFFNNSDDIQNTHNKLLDLSNNSNFLMNFSNNSQVLDLNKENNNNLYSKENNSSENFKNLKNNSNNNIQNNINNSSTVQFNHVQYANVNSGQALGTNYLNNISQIPQNILNNSFNNTSGNFNNNFSMVLNNDKKNLTKKNINFVNNNVNNNTNVIYSHASNFSGVSITKDLKNIPGNFFLI